MVCMCVCGGTILHSVPRKKRIKRQKNKNERWSVSISPATWSPQLQNHLRAPKVCICGSVCVCAFGGRGIKSVKSLSVLELKCSDRSVH